MLRYVLAAFSLKMFSMNNYSRNIYRQIANTLGQKIRSKWEVEPYIRRGNLLKSICNRHNILNKGDKLLEIGTGWIHWYPIYLRLFYDVGITMLDVVDNRQFNAFKALFSKLLASIKTDDHNPGMVDILEKAISLNGFDDLYALLNLKYVTNDKGDLSDFLNDSFPCVFSFHVFEHIQATYLTDEIRNIYRILKPGGYSIHQIGIDDHLSHYDKKESPKKYLSYSDKVWRTVFENKVQYFNRLQVPDYLRCFEREGFCLLEKIIETCDIESLEIHPKYLHVTSHINPA